MIAKAAKQRKGRIGEADCSGTLRCQTELGMSVMKDPVSGRQLLVASTGGHLAQLAKWAPRIGATEDSLWITFHSPQSESLLQGKRVLYVPYVAPRDLRRTTEAFKILMRDIDWSNENFASAVTTGAAVGLAGLCAARIHGVPGFYFESVSRVNGPSLTGRLARWLPGVERSCQYEQWAGGGWKYRGSLFDDYVPVPREPSQDPRLFVTLGTIRPYRFDALIDGVLSTGFADSRTVWQVGETSRRDLPGAVASQLSREEFIECVRDADVVISHAGVGTLMDLLEMGVYPIVVPRRQSRGEHVDDHQTQVASVLRARGIALVVEADLLDRSKILEASRQAVIKRDR